MIITIDRECGCNGHVIAQKVADHYGIPMMDKPYLKKLAQDIQIYDQIEDFFEERPIDSFLYAIAMKGDFPKKGKQAAKVLRDLLSSQDFVMIGRCGTFIFDDHPEATSFFLHADREVRIQSIAEVMGLDHDAAEQKMDIIDEKRAHFQRYYANRSWGLAENYDNCIDTSDFTVDEVVDMITWFVDYKMHRKY